MQKKCRGLTFSVAANSACSLTVSVSLKVRGSGCEPLQPLHEDQMV